MKRILKKYRNLKKNEFIQKVLQIWDEFPQEKINSLVLSFKNRIKLVIAKNGESITEELRQGMSKLGDYNISPNPDISLLKVDQIIESYDPTIDDCPVEFYARRPFTIEEDIKLLNLVNQLGNKWKKMEPLFEQRTAVSLRNRWTYLRK